MWGRADYPLPQGGPDFMERNMRGQARKNLTESVSPPKEGGILLGRK